MDVNKLVEQLTQSYGDGCDGSAPLPDQWAAILARDPSQPVHLINFFKFRATSAYTDGRENVPGMLAFGRYSEVSVPTMQRVGGSFLMTAAFEGPLIGSEEDWDFVAIGSYPNLQAFLDLYQDPDYRQAFQHRSAACARQKVLIAA
jgi:uncharacterized protein (DUF1330 family)